MLAIDYNFNSIKRVNLGFLQIRKLVNTLAKPNINGLVVTEVSASGKGVSSLLSGLALFRCQEDEFPD